VLAGLGAAPHAYFVHSYPVAEAAPGTVLATADYDGPMVAAIGRDNLIGTQFHPEKSQAAGLALIANFLRWRP
jgi:glutamine amidotransferase